jgi:succinate dehydrogenase / fumarate reductase flavoprotein subunit
LDIKTLEKEKIPHSKVEELEKECLSWQKESENDVSSLDDEKEIISKNILSNIHHYDVIIIGGGLTGLRAALQVSDAQLKVAIISKVHPLRSHSVAAQGGMNASLANVPGPDGTTDNWKIHAYDTVKGSDYLADQDAVEIMCREAPSTVIELEHMGATWSRLKNGKIAQRPFGGAGFPRTCYAADRTGHNAIHTLYEQTTARNIPIYEKFFVTSLVTAHGHCRGCTALEIRTGKIHGFHGSAVLMATGGFGRLFNSSTNALINTGDGHSLALNAGVSLKDMEFVQFHPTTLYGTNILITEGARGEGGILLNKNGERFMEKYAPNSMDLAPRDVVARAIETEIAEGRGFEGGYVHLDLRHIGEKLIKERLPGIRQISIDFAGVDPINEAIPIQPGQHYSMGGIDVDLSGKTSLKGLYAAGECACISVHGANRLGGNSLLETVVFGRLVGDTIIEEICKDPAKNPQNLAPVKEAIMEVDKKIKHILARKTSKNQFEIKENLNKVMSSKFGIFRDQLRMEKGLLEIGEIKKQLSSVKIDNKELAMNQAIIRFLELEYLVQIAESVAFAALNREESRGSHTREDYPSRDDKKFLKHTIISFKDGKIQIYYKTVNIGIFEPKERVY